MTEAIGEPFVELVRQAAREQILVDPDGLIPIRSAALGDDAGVLGAALLALEKYGLMPRTGSYDDQPAHGLGLGLVGTPDRRATARKARGHSPNGEPFLARGPSPCAPRSNRWSSTGTLAGAEGEGEQQRVLGGNHRCRRRCGR